MNNHFESNGKNGDQGTPRSDNPYLDALSGECPPEIAEFEMSTYPYANVVPPISRGYGAGQRDEEGESYPARASLLLRAISMVILVGMLLAVVLGVAAHFYG
jgi:hypothetical protein